jgi:Transcription initiation factor IID, 18kD subunit
MDLNFWNPHTGKIDQKQVTKAEMTDCIAKMMFVSGETTEPSVDTTTLVEQIVQQQVQEMVSGFNNAEDIALTAS